MQIEINKTDNKMKTKEALEKICKKLGEVFDDNFPCICGDNPYADYLTAEDIEKLDKVLECLDLLKE